MNDLDPFDDELAAALQRRAGSSSTSVFDAHEAVLARAGHIRRRRALVAGGGTMTVLLIGGVLLLPRGDPGSLAPAGSGDVIPSVDSSGPGSTGATTDGSVGTATPTTVELSIPRTEAPSTSISEVPESTSGATTSTAVPSSVATSVVTTVATTSGEVTSPTTSGGPTTTDEAAVDVPAPFTRTYDSSGGSITVNWDGSRLSLLGVSPATGFTADVKDDTASRIRVDFDDGEADSRIEVRWDGREIIVSIS